MMSLDDLYQKYTKSLEFLFQKGAEFGHKYPKVAQALKISDSDIKDPDVRRLIESFALFDARINQLIEKEKDNLVDFLMYFTCPEICVPLPAATILQINSNKSVFISKDLNFKAKNKINFKPMLETNITQNEILSVTQIQAHDSSSGVLLQVFLKANTGFVDIYVNSNSAELILQNILLGPKIIYDNTSMKQIGKVDVIEVLPRTNMYSDIYNYSVLKQSFYFLRMHFDDIKTDITLQALVVLAKPLPRYILNHNTFLLNCIPIINIHQTRSEPMKFSNLKDNVEIIVDITSDKIQIQKILSLNIYDPAKGKEYNLEKDQYFCIDNKLYLSQNAKTKLGEYMILFADLICSNQDAYEISSVHLEEASHITGKMLFNPTTNYPKEVDKWMALSIFNTANVELCLDSPLEFVTQVMSVYGFQPIFESINTYEDVYVMDKAKAFSSVSVKQVFDINIRDNEFILGMIWSKILQDMVHLKTEIRINN